MGRLRELALLVIRNGYWCLEPGQFLCVRGMYEEYGFGGLAGDEEWGWGDIDTV